MTQQLIIFLGAVSLFLLIYGIAVKSKTVSLLGVVLTLVSAYFTYIEWWGGQILDKL